MVSFLWSSIAMATTEAARRITMSYVFTILKFQIVSNLTIAGTPSHEHGRSVHTIDGRPYAYFKWSREPRDMGYES